MKKANGIPLEKGLFAGVRELLEKALSAKPSKQHFCSKDTADKHANGKLKRPELDFLIEDMWKQVVTNWVEGGCRWSGSKNWCWRRSDTLNHEESRGDHDEVSLNRRLVRALTSPDYWSNETPTGSGMGKEGREPGGLDLAHFTGSDHVTLVELKTKDSNPMSAAFQVVGYGLFLVLARLTHERLVNKPGPIKIAEQWARAKSADLRVLARTTFYKSYLTLGWFEAGLNEAIANFGKKRGLEMTFRFCEFDDEFQRNPTETKLLAALNRPIKFVEPSSIIA